MTFLIPTSVISLRENPCLPCVKIFAVLFLSGARQRAYLSCVFCRAHDKEKTHGKHLICRAFFLAHGKVFFSPYTHRINQVSFFQKHFAVRFNFGARQTHVFAVRFVIAHAKVFFYLFSLSPKSICS
jgi:hypothetical protein